MLLPEPEREGHAAPLQPRRDADAVSLNQFIYMLLPI